MVEIKEVFTNCINKFNKTKKEQEKKSFLCFLFDLKKNSCELKMNIDTKCLVLTSSPGGEIKGLGGLISQYPKNFEILSFTNGSKLIKNADSIDSSALIKVRYTEIMKKARVKGYKIFNIDDETLNENFSSIKKIDISEIDYLFIPNLYDTNPDTYYLLKHLKELLKIKEHKKTLKIFMYETTTPLSTANYYVDISSIIETKKVMLETFYPRENYPDLVDKVIGLNAYHSIDKDSKYAEVFLALNIAEFCSIPVI